MKEKRSREIIIILSRSFRSYRTSFSFSFFVSFHLPSLSPLHSNYSRYDLPFGFSPSTPTLLSLLVLFLLFSFRTVFAFRGIQIDKSISLKLFVVSLNTIYRFVSSLFRRRNK